MEFETIISSLPEEIVAEKVCFTELRNTGDTRGDSFTVSPDILSFLGRIADIHVASVLPGAVRGNHYHTRRKEALIVLHESGWTLHWDKGENTPAQVKEFSGPGAKVILIEPTSSHAVRNSGARTLTIIGLSSEPYDPQETIRREVT